MRPLDLLDQARPRSTHAARAQHARTQARAREEGLTAAGQKPKKGPDQEHGEAVPRAAVRRGAARAPPGRHGRRRQRPAPPGVSRPRSALFGTRVARWAGPVLIRFFFSRGVPQGYALSKWLRTKIHRLISLQVVLARVLGAVATRAARHRSPRSRARPRTERRGLGGGQGARADKMREEQAKVRRASEAAAPSSSASPSSSNAAPSPPSDASSSPSEEASSSSCPSITLSSPNSESSSSSSALLLCGLCSN